MLAVAVLFVVGVLLGEALPQPPLPMLLAALVLAGLGLASGWAAGQWGNLAPHRANLTGHPLSLAAVAGGVLQIICTILTLILAGWASQSWHHLPQSPHDLRAVIQADAEIVTLRGRLVATPSPTNVEKSGWGKIRLPVDVEAVARDGQWLSADGRVLLNTSQTLGREFYSGRLIEVDGVLAQPPIAKAPGMFDYRRHLARRGIHFVMRTDKWSRCSLVAESPAPRRALVDHFRAWAMNALEHDLPTRDEPLQLLWAMALGQRQGLDHEAAEPFMRSGTMHLFAISGLHIALVAGILVALLRVIRVSRGAVGLVAIPLLWFYTAATGWQPSAVRATIMMSVVLAGWALKRPTDLLNSIGMAAFIILAWDSQQLFQASFQLSFMVVFSLGLVLPPLADRLKRWVSPDPLLPRELWPAWRRQVAWPLAWLAGGASTSVAAWLASAPLVAFYFNLFTPVALLANVPVVLLGGAALASCLGSLVFAAWLTPVSALFNHAAWFFMTGMVTLSEWATTLPGAFQYVRSPSPWLMALYYIILFGAGAGWLLRMGWRRWMVIGAGVGFAATVPWLIARESETARVTLLADVPVVYQEAWGGTSDLLVDVGDQDLFGARVTQFLRNRGVDRVDQLVLTHGVRHHVGAFTNLMQTFPVGRVHLSHARSRSKFSKDINPRLEARPGWSRFVVAGDRLGRWEVLHPAADEDFQKSTDDAVVLQSTFHGVRVLLMSDLGRLGQRSLRRRHPGLRVDLVVTSIADDGHTLEQPLLAQLRPQVILVHDCSEPVGERAPEGLQKRLDQGGARVFYTRREGGLRVEFRPDGWRVRSSLGVLFQARD